PTYTCITPGSRLDGRGGVRQSHTPPRHAPRPAEENSRSDARLLPHLEGLDDVADLDVAVADPDTALEALADLGRVILEPAERGHREVVGDDHTVTDQPRLAVAVDRAGLDHRTGDVVDTRHLEDLADLRRAELDLFELGLEHALEGRFDFL